MAELPVWPFRQAALLGHGHDGATSGGFDVVPLVVPAPAAALLTDCLVHAGNNTPCVAADGHGDVLSERLGPGDDGGVLVRLNSDRGWLSWVVGVAPEMRVQAAGDLVPAPDARLVPPVER